MIFRIETPQFSGALAELVECIQNDTVDILDISLSDITATFITYLTQSASLPIIDAVDLHFYTSQLLLIKAQYLLGRKEEVDTTHLKEEVVDILIEFQRLKKLSDELCKLQLEDLRQLARKEKIKPITRHYQKLHTDQRELLISTAMSTKRDPQELSISLHAIAAKMVVIHSLPKFNQVSLRLMRDRLFRQLQKSEAKLSDLIETAVDRRAQLVSALLVVLVAVQGKVVIASQEQPFQTILIRKKAA